MMTRLLVAVVVAAAAASLGAPSSLRDHPIASGSAPRYLDGPWTATNVGGAAAAAGPLAATVPGDIMTDLQRAKRAPDPYFNTTWRAGSNRLRGFRGLT